MWWHRLWLLVIPSRFPKHSLKGHPSDLWGTSPNVDLGSPWFGRGCPAAQHLAPAPGLLLSQGVLLSLLLAPGLPLRLLLPTPWALLGLLVSPPGVLLHLLLPAPRVLPDLLLPPPGVLPDLLLPPPGVSLFLRCQEAVSISRRKTGGARLLTLLPWKHNSGQFLTHTSQTWGIYSVTPGFVQT